MSYLAQSDALARQLTTVDWILAGVIVLGALIIGIIIRRVVVRAIDRRGAEHAVAMLVGRGLSYLVALFGFFYALSSLDIQVGPMLGALGVGGIVLGLALQDILTNIVSGILLQTRRPFRRGDQIVTNDFQGTVQDINLRVVTLETFDGDEVFIPNHSVLQNPITNWTHTPTRRTTLDVGVAYDTDLDHAQQVLVEAVRSVEGVDQTHATEAFVYEFGDSSINFAVRFWHNARILEMWRTRDQVARAIKRALDQAEITIPFPQRTLWFGPGQTSLHLARSDRGSAGDQPDGPGAVEANEDFSV